MNESHTSEGTRAGFQTTRWTLVARLRSPSEAERAHALQMLVLFYFPPINAFFRARGMSHADADDAAQGFFTDKVLEGALFEKAKGGRLRALILTALNNYTRDLHRRELARGGRVTHVAIDTANTDAICATLPGERPEAAFERVWEQAELREAVEQTRAYFQEIGKAAHWAAYETCDLRPNCTGAFPVPHAQVAVTLGFPNAKAVGSAVQVVRKRLRVILDQIRADGD